MDDKQYWKTRALVDDETFWMKRARDAYAAYWESLKTSGDNPNSNVTAATFDQLRPTQQRAWMMAAKAAAR